MLVEPNRRHMETEHHPMGPRAMVGEGVLTSLCLPTEGPANGCSLDDKKGFSELKRKDILQQNVSEEFLTRLKTEGEGKGLPKGCMRRLIRRIVRWIGDQDSSKDLKFW